jgi:hypothetical protein
MTPFPNFYPAVGTASTATDLASHLGNVVRFADGKEYRLVKAQEAIASAANKVVSTALSSGAPTWVVDLAGTTGCAVGNPAGVVPTGQVGSTGTSTVQANDYFLVQVSGTAEVGTTGTPAAGDAVGATGSAGLVDITTALSAYIGTITEAATGAGTVCWVLLRNVPR